MVYPLSAPTEQSLEQLRAAISRIVAVPDDQWSLFVGFFRAAELRPGDLFVRAGEEGASLGFVNSGLMRFYYETADGKVFNKSFVAENEFVGAYRAILTGTRSRVNIQALEPTRLLVAPYKNVIALFGTHPCWQTFGRIIAEQLYIRKEQREEAFLLDDAETRYRNFLRHYPGLEARVPQYHIAGYLGITAVALSRIRRKLRANDDAAQS